MFSLVLQTFTMLKECLVSGPREGHQEERNPETSPLVSRLNRAGRPQDSLIVSAYIIPYLISQGQNEPVIHSIRMQDEIHFIDKLPIIINYTHFSQNESRLLVKWLPIVIWMI